MLTHGFRFPEKRTATTPAAMIGVLQATALPAGGAVPNYDYGYGIIRPVAAGQNLGIIP